MKIAVIADPHVVAGDDKVHGIDTSARFAACIKKINEIAPDADLCVILGDLVDRATEESYRRFRYLTKPLKMPVRLLIGNHDNRKIFIDADLSSLTDHYGFVQSVLQTDSEVLLFLDTHDEVSNAGEYCERRFEWLRRELQVASNKPTYLFMHHPPFKTGFFIDNSMLRQAKEFRETIRHEGNVRHVFIGHTHRATSGSWSGVGWTTLHGLAGENDFELLPGKPNYLSGPAQVGVLTVNGDECVFHFQEAMNTYSLVAYSGRSIREPSPTIS